MRKSDVHQSKYFKAVDFPAEPMTVEIEMCRLEEFQQDGGKKTEKLVVYFRRQKSGLVVGPTVWDQFIEATGEEDSDDWPGCRVELYRDKTPFGGKMVPCIRVRKPEMAPPAKKPSKKSSPPPSDDDDMNDSVEY